MNHDRAIFGDASSFCGSLAIIVPTFFRYSVDVDTETELNFRKNPAETVTWLTE